MDIINTVSDLINFTQNPVGSIMGALIGGGSVVFALYKGIDKAVDAYLKRMDPDRFFIRLRHKAELFADGMVKGIRFFDNKLLDPVKHKLPKTGMNLETLVVNRINEIQTVFNNAFDKAKLIVRDEEK